MGCHGKQAHVVCAPCHTHWGAAATGWMLINALLGAFSEWCLEATVPQHWDLPRPQPALKMPLCAGRSCAAFGRPDGNWRSSCRVGWMRLTLSGGFARLPSGAGLYLAELLPQPPPGESCSRSPCRGGEAQGSLDERNHPSFSQNIPPCMAHTLILPSSEPLGFSALMIPKFPASPSSFQLPPSLPRPHPGT